MFCIAVQCVEEKNDGWRASYGLPTFFLDESTQMIAPGDTEHAERVARAILEPIMRAGVTLHIAVSVL